MFKSYICHIYKAKDGWRWHVKSGNGRIVAESGEAYTRRFACKKAWWKFRNEAYRSPVVFDKD